MQTTRSENMLIDNKELPTDKEKMKTSSLDSIGAIRRRAVLLNPPGTKHYFRDYFCTLSSKARYYYHPVDLIYLSGILDHAGYYLDCIDAIAENLSPEQTMKRIEEFNPEVVIYLLSSPSYEEDVPFMEALRNRIPDATLIGSGDVYRDLREDAFNMHSFCDAILTDFSTDDLVHWLEREEDETFDNIIYRSKDGTVHSGHEKHGYGFYTMPMPRWDLWHRDGYIFPFSEQRRWATMITDFGCPFSCTFCPMSTTGYKLRDIDTVMDELRMLRELGIHEIFFRDQTFGVNRIRTEALLKRIREEFPELRWICWSRVDVVNEEFLRLIKESGCHTIMYGIETANEEILKKYKKRTKRSQIEEALLLSRSIGLKTVGTLIIGLPGESEESIQETIRYVNRLPIDYASFNIASPRLGTTFRKEMSKKGTIGSNRIPLDSSHTAPTWGEDGDEITLPSETILHLQKMAIHSFYLRPGYLLRRLLTIKTPYQLWAHFREAWDLLLH